LALARLSVEVAAPACRTHHFRLPRKINKAMLAPRHRGLLP